MLKAARTPAQELSRMWSNVNATSRAVTGIPSWKCASGRSRKRAQVKSSATMTASAKLP